MSRGPVPEARGCEWCESALAADTSALSRVPRRRRRRCEQWERHERRRGAPRAHGAGDRSKRESAQTGRRANFQAARVDEEAAGLVPQARRCECCESTLAADTPALSCVPRTRRRRREQRRRCHRPDRGMSGCRTVSVILFWRRPDIGLPPSDFRSLCLKSTSREVIGLS